MNDVKNPLSFQLDPKKLELVPSLPNSLTDKDFELASEAEKESLVVFRNSVSFWQDAMRRFRKNPIAMGAFITIIIVFILAFIVPVFYPYTYEQQIRGSENIRPMQYSQKEQARIELGEKVWPHILGTDSLGRDMVIRILVGARISLIVGLIATLLVLVIGSVYGSISGIFGGRVDLIMQRFVEIVYTVPDILIIILLSVTLKAPITKLAEVIPIFGKLGVGLISVFITFSLLYWVGMARMVRAQTLMLKEQEFVTAARALGAGKRRIIMKHILPNCIGTITVTTTLQIPSAIFVESFLSFLGLGVSAPMPSLGSLAASAISGINSYPYRLLAPAIAISVIILAFNLLGDGLRDAFDPKLKK